MAEMALRNVCKQFDSEHYGVKAFKLMIAGADKGLFIMVETGNTIFTIPILYITSVYTTYTYNTRISEITAKARSATLQLSLV